MIAHTISCAKTWGQLGAKTRARTGRKRDVRGVRSADSTGLWRKRVGVEPTILAAKDRINGFEGHENHRIPFASSVDTTATYCIRSTRATGSALIWR